MKINNKEYGFTIEPYYNNVRVEIYSVDGDDHIHLLSKEFGRFYRKPIRSDYLNASKWAKNQIECISEFNN